MARWTLIGLVALAACQSGGEGSDVQCPSDRAYHEPSGSCELPANVEACATLAEDEVCQSSAFGQGLCRQGVCRLADCGDGVLSTGEQCDGDELGGTTCASLGNYGAGTLACNADCTFVEEQCEQCGDGIINGDDETCDGDQLPALTCADIGKRGDAQLGCRPQTCSLDDSMCDEYCGDGIPNGLEECDESLPANSCVEEGYDMGTPGCSAICATDATPCVTFGYERYAPPVPYVLQQVFAVDGGFLVYSIFAAAKRLYFFDGTSWIIISESANHVLSVNALDEIYTAASRTVSYGDGTNWTQLPAIEYDTVPFGIVAVAARAPDDVYAALTVEGIRHYDGEEWSAGSGHGSVRSLFLDDTFGSYATTDQGLLRLEDGTWNEVPGVSGILDELRVVGDRLYAYGRNGAAYVLADDWQTIDLDSSNVRCIAGTSNTHVFAATQTALYHFDGVHWASLELPAGGVRDCAMAVDRLVAATDDRDLKRFNGRNWIPNANNKFGAVWAADRGTAFQFTGAGIRRYSTGAWGAAVAVTGWIQDIHGTSVTLAYAAGEHIHRLDGATWTQVHTPTNGDNMASVFVADANNVFAVGGTTLVHFNGTDWNETPYPDLYLAGVHGTSADNVFVVSYDGTILHYDGTSWTSFATNGEKLYNDVFAVDDHLFITTYAETEAQENAGYTEDPISRVYHYDGSTWSDMGIESDDGLLDISGTSPTDLYLSGHNMELLHYGGVRWGPVATRGVLGEFPRLSVTDGAVYLAGDGLILTEP